MLSNSEITSVEAVVKAFAPKADIQSGVEQLARACQQYSRALRQQNPDAGKLHMATLERANPAAYAKVLATIPAAQQIAVAVYVAQYAGKPLPAHAAPKAVSVAMGISTPAGPVTPSIPVTSHPAATK